MTPLRTIESLAGKEGPIDFLITRISEREWGERGRIGVIVGVNKEHGYMITAYSKETEDSPKVVTSEVVIPTKLLPNLAKGLMETVFNDWMQCWES